MLSLLFVLACSQGATCVDRGQCGDQQVCSNGNCKDVACATSADCGIGEFCDLEGGYECREGCTEDIDCLAGEECDLEDHACREYECRSTDLDCELGENCQDGECENTMGSSCDPCNDPLYSSYYYGYYGGTGCGNNGTCLLAYLDQDAPWCAERCNPDDGEEACPRGFECGEYTPGDFYCFGWCPAINFELSNPD